MLRRLLLILSASASLADVLGQRVDLRAACSAKDCPGQDSIGEFTGTSKLTFLSGDTSCHIVDIEVKPNVSLLYDIHGDKIYRSRFENDCFRPVHSTVLKELFFPIQDCSGMLINVECKQNAVDVFLISKQDPGECSTAGLQEVELRFQYQVGINTLNQCGEQKKGVWRSVSSWFKKAWTKVKSWF